MFKKLVLAVGLLLPLMMVACVHHVPSVQRPRSHSQTLFLALDGVPYSLMKELYAAGYFRGFQEPSKVIAPFPSTTIAGFGGLFAPLGADKPVSYDETSFSYDEKFIRGSILGNLAAGYYRFFDYYRNSPRKQLFMYAFPGFSGHLDLNKARRLIWRRPEQKNFVVYIGGTDGAGHILGQKRMRHWLIYLDRYLQRLRQDYRNNFKEELNLALFSDHGFSFSRLRPVSMISLKHRLQRQGLLISRNLFQKNHVVPLTWGNISGASFYTDPSRVPQVAQIITEVPGVDIVTYRAGSQIFILKKAANAVKKAQILYDARHDRFKYQTLAGDPLGYQSVLEQLKLRKQLDGNGYASSRHWLEATEDHQYPDALFRIHEAFFSLVKNPAPILCSTDQDREFGDAWTRVGAWFHGGLKGTHGGLFQAASGAFVMATDPHVHLPAVLRYNEVLPHFQNWRDL